MIPGNHCTHLFRKTRIKLFPNILKRGQGRLLLDIFLGLHYFIQLVQYNDETEFEKKQNFVILHLQDFDEIDLKENEVNSIIIESHWFFVESYSQKSASLSSTCPKALGFGKNLRGCAMDRLKVRKTILDKFQINCNEYDLYKCVCSELIDFEESLILI